MYKITFYAGRVVDCFSPPNKIFDFPRKQIVPLVPEGVSTFTLNTALSNPHETDNMSPDPVTTFALDFFNPISTPVRGSSSHSLYPNPATPLTDHKPVAHSGLPAAVLLAFYRICLASPTPEQ